MESVNTARTSISKFDLTEKCIYSTILWMQDDQDLFHIRIYDGDSSWSGTFSNDLNKTEKFRRLFDETHEEYCENIKAALIGIIGKNDSYEYNFTEADSINREFVWKKKLSGKKMAVYGKVSLHRDQNQDSKEVLIDFLLLDNRLLRENIMKCNEEKESLNRVLEKCRSQLEEFVNIKDTLEKNLYGKFIQILNEKKRRSKLLKERINNFGTPIYKINKDDESD